MTLEDYLSSIAERNSGCSLNEDQKTRLCDFVSFSLPDPFGPVGGALDELIANSVEYEYEMSGSDDDLTAAEEREVREVSSEEIYRYSAEAGYVELAEGRQGEWTLNLFMDHEDVGLDHLNADTITTISDLISSGHDYGRVYQVNEPCRAEEDCPELRSAVKKVAEDMLGNDLNGEILDFLYEHVTRELESPNCCLVHEAVNSLKEERLNKGFRHSR